MRARPGPAVLAALGLVSILAVAWSCGGKTPVTPEPPLPTAAPPTATPTPATPAPTAAPTATPEEPDDCEDCNPGPVASVGARVFYAGDKPLNQNGTKRCGADDPTCYDPVSNNDILFANEFAIFDVTPRNAANQKCCRDARIDWEFENGQIFDHVVGSNKFQYRVYAPRRGIAQVFVFADGVRSNPILNVQVR